MNLLTGIPAKIRFEGGAHPRFILERVAVWPQVRGNATWLVPPRHSGPNYSCPYCHEDHPIALVCDDRPEQALSDYDELCPVCNLPLAFHGILGVVFCRGCGGALRVKNEMDVGSSGSQMALTPVGSPPKGDGGPSFYQAVWQEHGPSFEDVELGDPQYQCYLCKRHLPLRAFHFKQSEHEREYASKRCRRCEREWKDSLRSENDGD